MTVRIACLVVAVTAVTGAVCFQTSASENVPHTPFAEWAETPERGQLIARLTYQESEAYYFWAGTTRYKSDLRKDGEHYGIDINQGYLSLQYGLNDRWAADLALGYTTTGWRFFSADGRSESTSGFMDIAFGVRYQLFREDTSDKSSWIPSVAFRAGAVLPGSFDEEFPFAPGGSSAAIEPELLARKHLGWEGFGAYADALFRWNRTSANDQWIVAIGLFQQIGRWELNAGYRHLGSINGDNIRFDPAIPEDIFYPRAPRENQDSVEAGFSYRTAKRDIRLGFYSRTVFDGANTDKKFWVGGFVEMPFNLLRK